MREKEDGSTYDRALASSATVQWEHWNGNGAEVSLEMDTSFLTAGVCGVCKTLTTQQPQSNTQLSSLDKDRGQRRWLTFN